MKNFKKKTMTMALFGLLAANASWNLINSEGTNYFAGQTIAEQSILASKNTSGISTERYTVEDENSSIAEFYKKDSSKKIVSESSNYEFNLEGLLAKAKKNEDVDVDTKRDDARGYVEYSFDYTDFDHKKEKEVVILAAKEKPKDSLWEIEKDGDIITIRKTLKNLKFDGHLKLADKKVKVKLLDAQLLGKKVGYKLSLEDTEGNEVKLCEDCNDYPVALDREQLRSATGFQAFLNDVVAQNSKKKKKAKNLEDERTCNGKEHKKSSEKRIECLIAHYEDDADLKEALTQDEKEKVTDELRDILVEEFEGASNRYDFTEYKRDNREMFKGNRKFSEFARKIFNETIEREEKEERIARNNKETRRKVKLLKREMKYFGKQFRSIDKHMRKFESLKNYARRDLQERAWACDTTGGLYGQASGRDYFSGVVGFTFNFRDGFQSLGSQNSRRSMVTAPQVNPMGGMNNWNQMQAQWDAMNRQNAQMQREWCMKDVQTAKKYWNWEMANYEDNYLAPAQYDLQTRLERLDLAGVFSVTYKNESDYNGGLHRDDFELFHDQLNAYRMDLDSLGIGRTESSDSLYDYGRGNSHRNNSTNDLYRTRSNSSSHLPHNSGRIQGRGAGRG